MSPHPSAYADTFPSRGRLFAISHKKSDSLGNPILFFLFKDYLLLNKIVKRKHLYLADGFGNIERYFQHSAHNFQQHKGLNRKAEACKGIISSQLGQEGFFRAEYPKAVEPKVGL